ncbi:MAG: ATP-binding protein [Armatimonadetes bacterium]|nr:ATP-binding protein [Armatimonadota bacterium]
MISSSPILDVAIVEGSPPTVRLTGQVDFRNRQQVSDVFDFLLADGECTIRADLSGVSYVDSSGLSILVKYAAEAMKSGGAVELVGISPQVARVVTLCGAAAFFKSSIPDVPVCSDDHTMPSRNFWHVSDFHIPARPESAAMARNRVANVLNSLPFSRAESTDILLAVGEALANAIKHGCGYCADKSVSVRCVAGPSRLSIDITDPGPGFDPDRVAPPIPSSLAEGGMGIYMMRSLMDEVSFAFEGRTNVRLVKHIGAPARDSADLLEALVEA